MSSNKDRAYKLIDGLAPSQLSALVSLLETMLDPVARSLAQATVEETPGLPDEAAALDEARSALDRGEGMPHEDILREFGLRR